jgi:hypothetical protein
MTHDDPELAVPLNQNPPVVLAIRGDDELAGNEPTTTSTYAAPVESDPLAPLPKQPTDPFLSASGAPLSNQNAAPAATQSGVATALAYNNHVALDGVSGMEVDSEVSDSDSALGDSFYGYNLTNLSLDLANIV